MQMKNTSTGIVNYEKTGLDKKKKKKKKEKCNMTSSNLGKSLEYLRSRLRSENLRKYYLCKGICSYVFLCPERYYTSTK